MQFNPQGYIIHANSEGYFENPFSYDNIRQESRDILEQVLNLILEKNKNSIDSIYVRGSFVSNSYIQNYSDIDLIIIYTSPLVDLPKTFEWEKSILRLDIQQFPNASLLDVDHAFRTHFMLKVHSVHLYGENRIPEIPRFKASKETAFRLGQNIPKLIDEVKIYFERKSVEQYPNLIKWVCRGIIRETISLFMDREMIYTRDLVYCYEYFIKYYPQYESQMKILLEQAIEPTFTKDELLVFIDEFGINLAKEIEEYFIDRKIYG